ncbi:AURR1 aurofusarin regulatory protein [Trichophyton equinum CBS 127.97]|uniref:AURR1 aurofusarin regulatory protein n=1 Tax=Trichophyton equinum (strain ATCC MYA-4606 / CBS 127.97) TaxID=559882 RepID=F2PY37_TRIEC|nr:AURR1 aurofusarin regulatory protein [Trichophyton equinum CBS 127.97]
MESATGGRTSPHPVPVRRLDNIRASCDNCSRSKVRCSKEQPKCQRCVHQGVSCIYSPSQRVRRRPLREPMVEFPRRNNLARETSNKPIGSHDGHIMNSLHHNELGNHNINHDDKTRDRVHGFDMDFDRTPIAADSHQAFSEPSMFPADVDSPWGGLIPTFDEPPHLAWQFEQPGPFYDLDPHFPPRFNRGEGAKSPQSPLSHSRFDENTTGTAMIAAATSSVPGTPGTATPILSSRSSQAPRRGSRSFEIILRDNRTALDDMLTILQCPCTVKAELVFLVTAVCSRVLSWYEASLERSSSGCSISSATTSSSNASTSSSSTSAGSTAATTSSNASSSPFFDWVSIPSIRMGAYALDHEHSERMVAQLIQTELTKVKEVIDAFARTYCNRNDGPSKYGPHGLVNEDSEDKLHLALEAFLRSRLRAAVRAAREHLG